MADTTLTLEQIELGIAHHFDFRANIIVPNVSWGMLTHEADIIVMSKAGYLTEIEIKRSWSDFLADFRKSHKHDDDMISWYYYAVPKSISGKCRQKLEEIDPHKKWGLLEYSEFEGWCYVDLVYYPTNKNEHSNLKKLSMQSQFQFARLGAMRTWSLKNKIIKIETR